ncbi:transglutaminase-like domain-containing protein [Desulfoprunum benzoelyticum]|nr:transglutaminase-like domain-containing protein [Desulfoprunum benzoelyticum]
MNHQPENYPMEDFEPYLAATAFVDHDHPVVVAFAERVCAGHGNDTPIDRAVRLYYAVRDEIRYDPYSLQYSIDALTASAVITRGYGYCVAKAVVLAAVARQQGIPARLGFADVRNHLTTARLRQVMGTDLFVYHGYTELYLEGKWVKATPAFNLSLCQRFQVQPLEFDGRNDSIFHEFNTVGQRHMEYIHDYGSFADLPFEEMFVSYRSHYPLLFAGRREGDPADFHREAELERKKT